MRPSQQYTGECSIMATLKSRLAAFPLWQTHSNQLVSRALQLTLSHQVALDLISSFTIVQFDRTVQIKTVYSSFLSHFVTLWNLSFLFSTGYQAHECTSLPFIHASDSLYCVVATVAASAVAAVQVNALGVSFCFTEILLL